MLQSGLDITPVITHRFPYRDFEEAFAVARSGQSGKVILDWTRTRGGLMYGTLRDDLARNARRDPRGRALQARARDHDAAGRARRRRPGAASCSTSAPTTTSGSPTIPAIVAAAHEALDRWGYGMASVRFICGTQALHRELEERLVGVPRHRGHDPLQLLLRRERRPVRGAARRGGRGHLRRSSTTPRSSTASGSARRSGCATRTATWTSSRRGSRRRPTRATG